MRKKYFFFDIDGTLTNDQTKQIIPSSQLALQKLEEAGHFVSIATGRAHYKARPFMEKVHLHNMVCCGGGALVINDELVMNIPLDLEKAKTIIRQAEKLNIGDKIKAKVVRLKDEDNNVVLSRIEYEKKEGKG